MCPDRWAVTRLNVLIEKCFQGYDDFDFNVVTHAVNDFCVVELSNFYLDIIKDRAVLRGEGRAWPGARPRRRCISFWTP